MSYNATGAEFDGKNYVLKDLEEGEKWDLLIASNPRAYDSKNRLIVEKMKAGLNPNDAVGFLYTPIESDMTQQGRLITVGTKGMLYGKSFEELDANVPITGEESTAVIDLFDGDATVLQKLYLTNDIASFTSLTETGLGTLTKKDYNPLGIDAMVAGEYMVVDTDDALYIILGGTSVSGTNNYTATYNTTEGKIKKCIEEQTETLTVTTNVATLTENIDDVVEVNALVGTSTGPKVILYDDTATPAAGQVMIDKVAGTATFAAADAVTSALFRYKTGNKPIGKTMEMKEAGEPIGIDFYGGHS